MIRNIQRYLSNGKKKFSAPTKFGALTVFEKRQGKSILKVASRFDTPNSGREIDRNTSSLAVKQIEKPIPSRSDEGKNEGNYYGTSDLTAIKMIDEEAGKHICALNEDKSQTTYLPEAVSNLDYSKEKEKSNLEAPFVFKIPEKDNSEIDEIAAVSSVDKSKSSLHVNDESRNVEKTSVFDKSKIVGIEIDRLISSNAIVEHTPVGNLTANPNFDGVSTPMQVEKTGLKATKEKLRSYFTDTSRNGYNEQKFKPHDGTLCDDASRSDNLSNLDMTSAAASTYDAFPSLAESGPFSESLNNDDEEPRRRSTYLTEENQKSLFPQSPQNLGMESDYRVEAPIVENRVQRKSKHLTDGNKDTISSQPASLTSQRKDSKSSITSIDESAMSGNSRLYGETPDELMAEEMRIAREQEERRGA